ncbi:MULTISPECIES: DUF423 domain-containing protein [Devosia]|uniref:DUF423 domain-containing protein n=1 Tax=Devosia TaxID=46913 RepID=UPI000CE96654|nr:MULTISPECIES: DUF423 domain-containing protein [Devosia]AVF04862.1 DUF423 domain-containing protein [Devosia sp. I507]
MARLVPRHLLVLAGLMGALGVAAAAAASHGESRNLGALETMFLAHAPVLVALGLFGQGRVLLGAGLVLAIGTLLFGGDLAMRQYVGQGLFGGAAPLGGGLMMLGWAGLALAGLVGKGRA